MCCCLRRTCATCATKIQGAPCPLCRAPKPTTSEALAQIRRHAENDVPEAYSELTSIYRDGELGQVKDTKLALKFYKRAVEARGRGRDGLPWASLRAR